MSSETLEKVRKIVRATLVMMDEEATGNQVWKPEVYDVTAASVARRILSAIQGEPVAWVSKEKFEFLMHGSYREAPVYNYCDDPARYVPLYTHPIGAHSSEGERIEGYAIEITPEEYKGTGEGRYFHRHDDLGSIPDWGRPATLILRPDSEENDG